MRDRFVRIPLHPWTDETPGDDFDMHMYMLHICCEHVRRALELSLPGWMSLVAVLIPSFEVAAYHPHGEPFLMVALGVLLILAEIGLQARRASLLKPCTRHSHAPMVKAQPPACSLCTRTVRAGRDAGGARGEFPLARPQQAAYSSS